MGKFYTGVGSRSTPKHALDLMSNIASVLGRSGWTLRSGGAAGADSAFERGCGSNFKEIYYARDCTPEAQKIASRYHPAWNRCSAYVRKLHGRNSFQVLGRDLNTPSKFLICWTPDGCAQHSSRSIKTGGTGTAISIAWYWNADIYNLFRVRDFDLWSEWVAH